MIRKVLTVAFAVSMSIFSLGLTLFRGADGDSSFKYWAVEDTYITKSDFESNYGRSHYLIGGPESTILIKFGDLERMIGRDQKITSAKLVLKTDFSVPVKLKRIAKLNRPWSQGAGYRGYYYQKPLAKILYDKKNPKDKKKFEEKKSTTFSEYGANWNFAQAGKMNQRWELPGAFSEKDATEITSARLSQEKNVLTISGLESSLQDMLENPFENNGFAINFESNVEIGSSDTENQKPILIIETEKNEALSKPLTILYIQSSWSKTRSWPEDKTPINYTAYIKNTSDKALNNIEARWYYKNKISKKIKIEKNFKPGEIEKISISIPFEKNEFDSRFTTLKLALETESGEKASLEIDQNAYPLSIVLSEKQKADLEKITQKNNYSCIEEYLQSAFRFWNETLLGQSRFSFAPDGSTKRVRIQSIYIQKEGGIKPISIPGAMAVWTVPDTEKEVRNLFSSKQSLRNILFYLNKEIGLPDLSKMTFAQDKVKVHQESINLSNPDKQPGLMKGGNTRDERTIPFGLALDYNAPKKNQSQKSIDKKATDLYSATTLALIEKSFHSSKTPIEVLNESIPKVTVVKAINESGLPLVNTELEFYQSIAGSYENTIPSFTVTTDKNGFATLKKKKDKNIKSKDKNIFGEIDTQLDKGLFLIKAKGKTGTDWGTLKAWHMADAFYRGARSAAILNIYFSIPPSEVDLGKNLARNKIVTDSQNSMPAKLAAIVSDSLESEVELTGEADNWIELDLGRDKPLGRITLDVIGDFVWPEFDIVLYQTGQKISEAIKWKSERQGLESFKKKGKPHPENKRITTLTYYGPALTARYVRLIVKKNTNPMKLAGIRVYSTKG